MTPDSDIRRVDSTFYAGQLDKLRQRRDKQLQLADTAQSNRMRDWHLNEVRALTLDIRKLNGADKLVRHLDKDARRRKAAKAQAVVGYIDGKYPIAADGSVDVEPYRDSEGD